LWTYASSEEADIAREARGLREEDVRAQAGREEAGGAEVARHEGSREEVGGATNRSAPGEAAHRAAPHRYGRDPGGAG
jgi:hypothetical protein